ncbi:unnamed protein product, partial [Soboliphyme baturini]|uniref:Uncharacterized protein n=1 Tax=Soboliphyme baturini TaxID=241478 RepID=A0A183IAJ6_9BILA
MQYESPFIEVGIWHDQSLNDGLHANVQRVIPNFAVTYMTLTIFCVITNLVWDEK